MTWTCLHCGQNFDSADACVAHDCGGCRALTTWTWRTRCSRPARANGFCWQHAERAT